MSQKSNCRYSGELCRRRKDEVVASSSRKLHKTFNDRRAFRVKYPGALQALTTGLFVF
jgi:hypothetical protein